MPVPVADAGPALDRGIAIPLYVQVVEALRADIRAGTYGDHGALPSEARLQARFGISRVTARQALQRLVDDGLIERRQGKGSFVAGARVRHRLEGVRGFYDELVGQGLSIETELLVFEPEADAPDGLGTRLARLYRADGEPIALVRAHLPAEALALGREAAESQTIYGLVEDGLGRSIARSETTVGATPADAEDCDRLGLPPGSWVLTLGRRSLGHDGRVHERAVFLVRPDRYEFTLFNEHRGTAPNMRIRPVS